MFFIVWSREDIDATYSDGTSPRAELSFGSLEIVPRRLNDDTDDENDE